MSYEERKSGTIRNYLASLKECSDWCCLLYFLIWIHFRNEFLHFLCLCVFSYILYKKKNYFELNRLWLFVDDRLELNHGVSTVIITTVCLARIDVKMRIDHWYDPMKLKIFSHSLVRSEDDYFFFPVFPVCSQNLWTIKNCFFLLIFYSSIFFFSHMNSIQCAVVKVLTICSSLGCICRIFVRFFSASFSSFFLRIALTMFIQCMYYSYGSIIVNDIHCVRRWCIVYQNLLYLSSISFFTWKELVSKNSWELFNCSLLLLSWIVVNALIGDEPGPFGIRCTLAYFTRGK